MPSEVAVSEDQSVAPYTQSAKVISCGEVRLIVQDRLINIKHHLSGWFIDPSEVDLDDFLAALKKAQEIVGEHIVRRDPHLGPADVRDVQGTGTEGIRDVSGDDRVRPVGDTPARNAQSARRDATPTRPPTEAVWIVNGLGPRQREMLGQIGWTGFFRDGSLKGYHRTVIESLQKRGLAERSCPNVVVIWRLTPLGKECYNELKRRRELRGRGVGQPLESGRSR